MKADSVTKRWMRDASDELAIANGCWFDEERGQFAVDWMEENLCLYEGVWAGRPFEVCDDWQYEATMRLFGWVRPNVEWRNELPDSDSIRRFRRCNVFIAKKNKKSPTLSGWAVYVMAGEEGEEKVFPTAKNGKQIKKNVVRHIHEMIRQSPELSAEFTINKTTTEVLHRPTNSVMVPLSSDNVLAQQSNEGINGSIFVDEVHVVDRAHIARVDRAGISRPEPLHIEVSTVGNDIDSYGYERFEYCEGVISGEIKDDQTLAIIYAAPQDLKDADLFADPIKYGKMANPAWGHTVKEAEFLADFERSRKSLKALADFKMYRLNIWQASATPWLDMLAWDLCDGAVDLDAGGPVFCGLDLSSKKDFTAFVAVQDQGDTFAVEGHYWITEARAEKHAELGLGVHDWAASGKVTICPGERIDYDTVEDYVEEFCQEHDVETIGHDPWNVEGTRQRLSRSGIELVEIPQTFKGLSDASKSLETLVDAKRLAHGGDPVLRWMAKNATVQADNHDNYKPVKPPRSSMKAVDGIVALIMAVGEAESAAPKVASVYDSEWDF